MMWISKSRARVGAAAFAVGLAVAGPQVGVASADRSDSDSGSSASSHRSGPSRAGNGNGADSASSSNTGRSRVAGAAASAPARQSTPASDNVPVPTASAPAPAASAPAATVAPAAAVAPVVERAQRAADPAPAAVVSAPLAAAVVPPSAASASAVVGTPDPNATVTTQYGDLGKWMLQPNGQIADWVGVPYQGKTMQEGINVVFVDSASSTSREALRNINAWMRRAAFGASAFSSTGYQGIIDDTKYSQQPTGPRQAFRDGFFLLANSHGRAFGTNQVASGPNTGDFVTIGAWSEENLDLARFTHGYESFNQARDELLKNMVAKGAQNLGTIDMHNSCDTGADCGTQYTTGDADGKAAVIGLNVLLGQTRAYRGAPGISGFGG